MKGQTLITVLFFIAIGVVVVTSIITLMMVNNQAILSFERGTIALMMAETGAEEALINLLRNPDYKGGRIVLPQGTVDIRVETQGDKKIITSQAGIGSFIGSIRTIEVQVDYPNNQVLKIDSWQEVFK